MGDSRVAPNFHRRPYVALSIALCSYVISFFSRFESVCCVDQMDLYNAYTTKHIWKWVFIVQHKTLVSNLNFGSTESKSLSHNPEEGASRQAPDVPSRIQTRELCMQVLASAWEGCTRQRREETNPAGECVVYIKASNTANARPSGHRQDEEEQKL